MILGMDNLKKIHGSDEEEDLESLRLAALQSLKRKNEFAETSTYQYNYCSSPDKLNHYRSLKGGGRNKRGRFFGPHQGRGGKSFQGHFSRVRNTNLISLTPVYDEIVVQEKVSPNSVTSLTLPQDRYCKASDEKQGTVEEGTSKFNRYNNSDKSESESDVEDSLPPEDEVTGGKLERADSLEALMQELDDEIQGKPKGKEDNRVTEDKPKAKKMKKKKKLISESEPKSVDIKTNIEDSEKKPELMEQEVTNFKKVEIEIKDPVDKVTPALPSIPPQLELVPEVVSIPIKRRTRSRSPFNRRAFHNRPNHRNYLNHPPHLPPLHLQYGPPTNHFPPHMPFPNQQYNPMFAPPGIAPPGIAPPGIAPPGVNPPQLPIYFDRPLSPLAINTESLTTATLAPLSPRSAAFVLQNKAIIEKRRRSPRRSYSRSHSRSLSRSPRRSLTPVRRFPRRSISPRRSPRRVSPKKRSLSPNRRSVSPRRPKALKADNSPVNRPRVRERLGTGKPGNSGNGNSNRASKEKEVMPPKEEKPLDPVLEARKKKFESNEIGKKGIIRLKPKDEKPVEFVVEVSPVTEDKLEEQAENKNTDKVPDEFKELEELLNEEALLDDDEILLDQKVEDIFSDDDFVSDNEGRFKVKQKESEKVVSLSFTKLLNGVKDEIKAEALPDSRRGTRDKGGSYSSRYSERRTRARSPAVRRESSRRETYRESKEKPVQKKTESQEKPQVRHRILVKSEKPSPVMDRRFERKIEIKIKNPSKYEKSGKFKSAKKDEDKNHLKTEKIDAVESDSEITVEVEDEDEELKSDIIGNDSADEENSTVNEGDLRAQLSRKRAEKLHKLPGEEVSSRLLQFALQGAVFKKSKKKSRDKSITNSDGKLPIHLRLGLGGHSDILEDVKLKRKSRKRKNREVLDQM